MEGGVRRGKRNAGFDLSKSPSMQTYCLENEFDGSAFIVLFDVQTWCLLAALLQWNLHNLISNTHSDNKVLPVRLKDLVLF